MPDTIPTAALAAAFTEWRRRWVEEPARYASESAMLAQRSPTYGKHCAAYLMKIIAEQAVKS